MSEVKLIEKSGGVGFPALLFLVFLVLKLTHVIAWSWWWITAPLWLPAALLLLIAVAASVVVSLVVWIDG